MNVRALFALALMIGAVGVCYALAQIAWDAMRALPDKTAVERVASSAAGDLSLSRIGGLTRSANRPVPGAEEAGVRYVDGKGIVASRVGGELVREPAKLAYGPPIPPPRDADEYKLVVIDSAGEIDVRTHLVRLDHIKAPGADLSCTTSTGRSWPCGRRARTALRRLVRRRNIHCLDDDVDTSGPRPVHIASCAVAGVDMGRWLVEQGWAVPTDDAPDDFNAAHLTAKNRGLGLYDREPR